MTKQEFLESIQESQDEYGLDVLENIKRYIKETSDFNTILEMFEDLINRMDEYYRISFLLMVMKSQPDFFNDNFDLIINMMKKNDFLGGFPIDIKIFFIELLKDESYYKKIIDNLEEISNNPKLLMYIIPIVKKKTNKFNEVFERKLLSDEKRLQCIQELIRYGLAEVTGKITFENIEFDVDAMDELREFAIPIQVIIEELLDVEKKSFYEIEYIGKGNFSSVFKIGNKVIKVGKRRGTPKIPNSNKILQPIFRRELKGKVFSQFVEVSDYIESIPLEERTKENLYKFYKELRDEGIYWADADCKNIGRLKKDNNVKNNKNEMYVDKKSLGFNREAQDQSIRKKGEYVIIDTDFLYSIDDSTAKERMANDPLEQRYLREKKVFEK